MTSALTDEVLEETLSRWESVAYFAFDGYARHGRGIVMIERTDVSHFHKDRLALKYVIYDHHVGTPDAQTATLIQDYDPDWEILVQYLTPGGAIRTMRLRTGDGARHPKRVWLLDTLGMLQERPEDLQLPLPQIFWDFCETLEKQQERARETFS